MVKRYEEENMSLGETMKILQNQLDEYGDHNSNMMGTLHHERINQNQNSTKIKDLERQIEKLASSEKLKQNEIDRLKDALEKTKKKLKETED